MQLLSLEYRYAMECHNKNFLIDKANKIGWTLETRLWCVFFCQPVVICILTKEWYTS